MRADLLTLQNHDRARKLDLRLLRQIIRVLLVEILRRREFDLGVHFVDSDEISHLNETYVHHEGVTDVITFDYAEPSESVLHGEIFVCLPAAITQASQFNTTWQSELVRYVVHGVLHLLDYDDITPAQRKLMKRAEDSAVRRLEARFDFGSLGVPLEEL